MSQVEVTGSGKWLLFLAGISAVLAAVGRFLIQPVFSSWVFFTLKREPAKMAELLSGPLDEIAVSLREIRKCQGEQGEQIARVEGYLSRESR
jgi:hypothetical protein